MGPKHRRVELFVALTLADANHAELWEKACHGSHAVQGNLAPRAAAIAAACMKTRIVINTRMDRIPEPMPPPIETTEKNQGFTG
jgi:hypothetical protein